MYKTFLLLSILALIVEGEPITSHDICTIKVYTDKKCTTLKEDEKNISTKDAIGKCSTFETNNEEGGDAKNKNLKWTGICVADGDKKGFSFTSWSDDKCTKKDYYFGIGPYDKCFQIQEEKPGVLRYAIFTEAKMNGSIMMKAAMGALLAISAILI